MKRILLYTLSSSLLLASTLVSAVDQTVTRTVTVDLGAESTINIGTTGTSQTATPTPAVNADGTKTIPDTSINSVRFSATGAFACITRITSANLIGTNFALNKETSTDPGNDLTYELSLSAGLDGASGTGKTGTGTAVSGTTLAGSAYTSGQTLTITQNDTFIGVEAHKTGANVGTCIVDVGSIQAKNFKTSDTNSTSIPSTWKGKRTGVLTFTMSAL